MKIELLTIFPEMFESFLNTSILGRAQAAGHIQVHATDIRPFSASKHKNTDDYPFGGGAGMVMTPQPIASAIDAIDPDHKALRIFTSPKGETFKQSKVKSLIDSGHIIILCGHYEGVDQRIIDYYIDEEISIGDYVLTGGELPAMVITDCLARYVDGVISEGSLSEESFQGGLLEYPQYTRPQDFNGMKIPEVLVSGNHGEVDKWRKEQAIEITKKKRPDLLKKD